MCAYQNIANVEGKTHGEQSLLRKMELTLLRQPKIMQTIHWALILFYLSLILIPPFLPRPAEDAGIFSNFTLFSHFVFWYLWWPFVVLSMIFFGRAWCGFLCPEGSLSAYASRFGGNRPIPRWMKWGGIPLLAFIGITIYGQWIGVYEYAGAQLIILGGSTLLAVVLNLIYTRSGWVWCRYLCPVSLLFGVFSRLGALHFKVNQEGLREFDRKNFDAPIKKDPCPVFIYLPRLSTNRYCLMCFKCAGWKDSIHLDLRKPGAEILDINRCEPLFWEVLFLFGAIGLPIGVFHWSVNPFFVVVKDFIWNLGHGLNLDFLLSRTAPWWMLSNHPEAGEVFYVLDGVSIAAFILGATLISLATFSFLTAASTFAIRKKIPASSDFRTIFTRTGYLYTPLSLFSLFLGLSQLTFGYFQSIGMDKSITHWVRGMVLAGGALWSLYLAHRIIRQQGTRTWAAYLPHIIGVGLIISAWVPVLFG